MTFDRMRVERGQDAGQFVRQAIKDIPADRQHFINTKAIGGMIMNNDQEPIGVLVGTRDAKLSGTQDEGEDFAYFLRYEDLENLALIYEGLKQEREDRLRSN